MITIRRWMSKCVQNKVLRTFCAFLPLIVFLCFGLAVYLYGEQWNELYVPGIHGEWARTGLVVVYLVISPFMVTFRFVRRQYLRAVPWLIILGLMGFRANCYETYHDVDYFFMSYVLVDSVLTCDPPSQSSQPFTVCYAYVRNPWQRFLLRGKLEEMQGPFESWSAELKAALKSNRTTQHIVDSPYRRVRSFRDGYFYVEIALE